jgi:hypothetical protein
MNGWRHARAFLGLTLAVVAVWATMVTVTEASATPSMHCHRVPMPCCPPHDAGAAHCSAAQCFVQMPQEAETGARTPAAQATEAAVTVERQQFPAPTHALTGSVAWQPEVFRLKDDFRI